MPLPVFDSWGLLVRSDHALANNKSISPADIQDLPLFVSHQASGNDAISGWLGRDLASYNVVGTYNLLYNASIMVEAGLGSALCPDGVVSTDEHTPLTFLPLFPPYARACASPGKNVKPSRAANAYLDTFRRFA